MFVSPVCERLTKATQGLTGTPLQHAQLFLLKAPGNCFLQLATKRLAKKRKTIFFPARVREAQSQSWPLKGQLSLLLCSKQSWFRPLLFSFARARTLLDFFLSLCQGHPHLLLFLCPLKCLVGLPDRRLAGPSTPGRPSELTGRMAPKEGGQISIPEIIRKKRDGETLQQEEIRYFVRTLGSGRSREGQIGEPSRSGGGHADGHPLERHGALRDDGADPGNRRFRDHPGLAGTVARAAGGQAFHGGRGDKVSLPLAPALAACGCKMKEILEQVGCCIVEQSQHLVPADKVLYALRDVTATVDSLPLIISSILSKKMVEKLCALVLDVKFGSAALYHTLESAEQLAQNLVSVGNQLGTKTAAILSRMDEPVGCRVGNSLEVLEALQCLEGGGLLLWQSGRAGSVPTGATQIGQALDNGTALRTFQAMLQAQGVEAEVSRLLCEGTEEQRLAVLKVASTQEELRAPEEG
ncbi:hypothetical protein E2320_022790 [Naja naja]|nr:hypothetical protein E2320_022790 [Naja naja]